MRGAYPREGIDAQPTITMSATSAVAVRRAVSGVGASRGISTLRSLAPQRAVPAARPARSPLGGRALPVPICSLPSRQPAREAASQPAAVPCKDSAILAVWRSLSESTARAFKVLLATAAAMVASMLPFTGAALARRAPPPPPPAFVPTGSPFVDSWNLTFSGKLDLPGKLGFIQQDPLLAIVPAAFAVLAMAIIWAIFRKPSSQAKSAPPAAPQAPAAPAVDSMAAARQRTKEHVQKLQKASAAASPVAAAAASKPAPTTAKAASVKPAAAPPAGLPYAKKPLPEPANAKQFLSTEFNGTIKPPSSAANAVRNLSNEMEYLRKRVAIVRDKFPQASALDDFMFRVEMALLTYGFNADNTVAIANMCRDEITCGLKYKIEEAYPLCFNINGLGGGITCGVTGMGAGLSHSPMSRAGKQRYVFFSFPHIAITSKGVVGSVGRPGQDKVNAACGALIAALGQLKAEGVSSNIKAATEHVASDPEYSILKARIAGRIQMENADPAKMDLVDITKVAERQISADLEELIAEAVNPAKADYAIITGVQIHNWADDYDNEEPNFEFIAPTKVCVVIDGKRTDIDLEKIPGPTPRQLRMLMNNNPSLDTTRNVAASTGVTTVIENNGSPMFANTTERGMRRERSEQYAQLLSASKVKSVGVNANAPPYDDAVL